MDELIAALTILRKYGNPTYPTHCEHDTLTVWISPSLVSTEDKAKLDVMGFFAGSDADEEADCFSSFRYGSC